MAISRLAPPGLAPGQEPGRKLFRVIAQEQRRPERPRVEKGGDSPLLLWSCLSSPSVTQGDGIGCEGSRAPRLEGVQGPERKNVCLGVRRRQREQGRSSGKIWQGGGGQGGRQGYHCSEEVGIKASGGLSRAKANTKVIAAPTEPCPHTPAPSYKGPRPKQGVQAVEVPWPSHTCCHGCCCCPYSVVWALVSPPSLPLPPHPPGLGVQGALQTSPPFAEPWLCPKHYP